MLCCDLLKVFLVSRITFCCKFCYSRQLICHALKRGYNNHAGFRLGFYYLLNSSDPFRRT